MVDAQDRVDTALDDLDDARIALQNLTQQVHAATLRDRQMKKRLGQAIVRLRDARDDVRKGARDVQSQRAHLVGHALSNYQAGGTSVTTIAVAFQAQSPEQVFLGIQGSAAILDQQTVAFQQFEATKVLLALTEERVETTKNEVEEKRADAAAILQTKITFREQALTAKEKVTSRLGSLRDAKQEIHAAKEHERERLENLESERQQIVDALTKLAERRARQEVRRQARLEARQQRVSTPTRPSDGDSRSLQYPVTNTYVTSPYGMRMHPVLRVWKLHDGTDFQASCDTPVYAASSGRVMSEYYSTGYGNQIILDHGLVRGVSLQTSYNHLTSFVARSGQTVQRGQLIGYAGTTGYSTGCHVHFMVYVNGSTVDPMSWL